MQARIDGMNALRTRASAATAAFYGMINKPAPEPAVRYQVVNKGTGAYHVIELATGRAKGFRFSWKAALNLAQLLEARADGAKVNIEGWGK
ncbi:hypothetical protein RZO07_19585 [Pseudomonas protegens]|uniref:hypothetical protein n=1 Tax=Pseudomonas protegens TaxID=380021 RepID=UPI00293715D0|nr:hypothetical protein [Pseudomonas protegens]WOE77511.1 hypothetical protein RZO07_19585 [Pseudomonas protegens]